VLGGGIAGMTAAAALAELGHAVTLVELAPRLGGRLAEAASLFPDLGPASSKLEAASGRLSAAGVDVRLSTSLASLSEDGGRKVELSDGTVLQISSIVLATGLETIDPAVVPEYGHGRLSQVVTAAELEAMLADGQLGRSDAPSSIVFVQCVGSRSERRGVRYCGGTCCANALKQAILVKRTLPGADVAFLYIDLRTPGKGQEDLYREARRLGVRFVRGIPSLVLPRGDNAVVCGEDTLLRQLYELEADLVVLAMGVRQSPGNLALLDQLEVQQTTWGFPATEGCRTSADGVFVCGAAEGPKDSASAAAQAEACALEVHRFLKKKKEGLEGV